MQLEVWLKVGGSGSSGSTSWLMTGWPQCHSRWRSRLQLEVCCKGVQFKVGGPPGKVPGTVRCA